MTTCKHLRRRQGARRVVLALAAFVAAVVALDAGGIVWNTDSSDTRRLWRLEKIGAEGPHAGEYVLFCLPPEKYRLYGYRAQIVQNRACGPYPGLLKRVLGLAPALYAIDDRGISVNGRLLPETAPYPKVPKSPPANGTIPADMLLVGGSGRRNLDSRYFGMIPRAWVVATVQPLFGT